MNLVLIILDSQRQDHVGAYGNPWIRTPHLDAFAAESVRFSRAYPESLPTLPVRRALHTGARVFPFRGHRAYKGDFVGAAGWGPIEEERTTLAELLQAQGYRTAFVTDTYHQFKPSKNFHRGFDEWIWIRGQENDRYKSGPPVRRDQLAALMPVPPEDDPRLAHFLTEYLRNNAYRMTEADYYPARVFSEASRWLWDNQDAEAFLLVVDSFDPHEPWDPPDHYRRLYDPDDDVENIIQSLYGPIGKRLTRRQVKRLQANYAGEVTMVDRWFGYLMETLRNSGRLEDTVVAVISDHGHNIGLEPGDKGLISKQGHPITRGVADLVMMLRHPRGEAAGTACHSLAYNFDLTTTMLALAGIEPHPEMEGIDLWPVVRGEAAGRDYVSIGWNATITVIDQDWWYNDSVWGEAPLLHRLAEDADLRVNVAAEYPRVVEEMRRRMLADAGGAIPDLLQDYKVELGCTPYVDNVEP
ncbi:MAG: sulfatase-like hydrolase/transferase [Anaerolineae bacterium]|nr:sulfatase-like hydrolase/transferase [Anaerolineae bacterium]